MNRRKAFERALIASSSREIVALRVAAGWACLLLGLLSATECARNSSSSSQQQQQQPRTSVAAVKWAGRRTPALLVRTSSEPDGADANRKQSGLQISITPRVAQIRVPVESNAILKCLISAQFGKFSNKFDVHWSRYMYDENVYQQIEPFTGPSDAPPPTTELGVAAGEFADERHTNKQLELRDFLQRARQEVNPISELLLEATLSVGPVRASDNASYYCAATDGSGEQTQARIDLVALSRPIVQLERVQAARDSKSALVHWLVISDGNNPIKKTVLMVRNNSQHNGHSASKSYESALINADAGQVSNGLFAPSTVIDSDFTHWQRIELPQDGEPPGALLDSGGDSVVRADVGVAAGSDAGEAAAGIAPSIRKLLARRRRPSKRQRAFNLTGLLPGVTYHFKLAAINDLGQSEWSQLSATMPNEIPAQINEVFLLSKSNDSLAIGWRRPTYDSSKTIRYEMQLFDLNRTLTIDANTNIISPIGTPNTNNSSNTNNANASRFMYIFVNLNPGSQYHFHVRACSRAGCSAFSRPKLEASTLDGEPDEPIEVELNCESLISGRLAISWLPPENPRGQLLNYALTVHAHAQYLNQSGQIGVDEWRSTLETSDNKTLSVSDTPITVHPNTNYTARVCANNRQKQCGRQSLITPRASCSTPKAPPVELPEGLALALINERALALELPLVSRRNGSIDCIELILIRLPANQSVSQILPDQAKDIKIQDFKNPDNNLISDNNPEPQEPFAYLADQIEPSSNFVELKQQVLLGDQMQHTCSKLSGADTPTSRKQLPFDGPLRPLTYYTGFIRLLVFPNASQPPASSYSHYFEPIQTGALVPEPAAAAATPTASTPANPFSLNSQMDLQEMASKLGSSLKLSATKLYNSSTSFISDSIRLEALGNFIVHSSPVMQLLEVGVIVLGLSLLLLLVIYALTLPAAARRRRKRKLKRQLQRDQEQAALAAKEAASMQMGLQQQEEASQQQLYQQSNGFSPQRHAHEAAVAALPAAAAELSPVAMQPMQVHYAPRECPIHSSPQLAPAEQLRAEARPQPAYHSHAHYHHNHQAQQQQRLIEATYASQQHERNCRTLRRASGHAFGPQPEASGEGGAKTATLSQQNSVLGLAKKINKSIPLHLFGSVFECRLQNNWLKEEYEQLPKQHILTSHHHHHHHQSDLLTLRLRPQLIVSRNDSVQALISGNEQTDASLISSAFTCSAGSAQLLAEKRIICAKSPLDADSVWDFWRLVYEQEVSTLIMLTQTEDFHSGELRCAQYWPTCDNEETTILSPCNEFVQKSAVLPAKFKIRQETFEEEAGDNDGDTDSQVKVRRLTLIVMATRASENEQEPAALDGAAGEAATDEDDEQLVIVERNILHLQFCHWNTSSPSNRMRLIKFIEFANERHLRSMAQSSVQNSPTTTSVQTNPMLVHCANGLGRSGLFAAMSFVMDDLALKLANQQLVSHQLQAKVNLFQLVSRLRLQREMLLSPYRFYELLYQLTASCIPAQEHLQLV